MPKVNKFTADIKCGEDHLSSSDLKRLMQNRKAPTANSILGDNTLLSTSVDIDNLSQHVGQTEFLASEARLAAQRLYNLMYGTEMATPELSMEPNMGFKGDMMSALVRTQMDMITVIELVKSVAKELEDER